MISTTKDLLYIQKSKTNMKQNFLKLLLFSFVIYVCPVAAQQISPNLVGTNVWYNPNTTVWNLTADCGVQMIRIGGHSYDDNMPSKTTLLGWVKKIQAMGAEPIIQVSQYQSAAVAADLVRYFNIEKNGEIAPVKYWNIGNEPWLQNYALAGGIDVGGMVETYFKPRAEAMKEVDPTIKIYGPDFCYYVEFAINDLFGGKNDIAGKIPGKDYYYCDGISWHKYPQNNNINLAYGGIDDFKSSIVKCKQKVDQVNASHNRTGDNALVWGIGEFNAKDGSLVHSWENGQMFGGILGLCMKYEAKYATTWSMYENGGSRQGSDFSMIDGNMTPRASYRHMEFVAKYFKGNYIDGTSSSNDFFVYGAQNEEQTAIMIMHRAGGLAKEYSLLLNDTATTGEKYKLKVNAGIETPYGDVISPRTTQVIIFKGDSITKINYSSDDFDNNLPPVYSKFKLASALPEKPVNLQTNPISYNTIELTWNDNSDNEMGYIVEREGINGFELLTVLPPDSTSYTNVNLLPETSYSYRILAYNAIGKSGYSEISTAMTLATPAALAYNGPHSIPGKIQAEDFNDNEAGIGFFDTDNLNQGGKYRTTGVDIEASTDAGGGFNIAYVQDGEWLKYLIENVTPGTYDIAFRTASNTSGTKKIDFYLGDEKIGTVVPKNTGGWQNWETLYLENVEIKNAEPITMTLKFTGIEMNINWIEFGEDLKTSNSNGLDNRDIQAFYNKQSKKIIITARREVGESVINIVNITGQSFYKSVLSDLQKTEIITRGWAPGIYMVSVLK